MYSASSMTWAGGLTQPSAQTFLKRRLKMGDTNLEEALQHKHEEVVKIVEQRVLSKFFSP